jgi:phosphatidylserine/phosphatidylglycerophosphate/cardiolipin synthase-like enzyme
MYGDNFKFNDFTGGVREFFGVHHYKVLLSDNDILFSGANQGDH